MPNTVMTVARHLSSWLSARSTTIAPRTAESYHDQITLHINPAIGDILIADLRPDQVSHMLADIMAAGHTRTAVLCHVTLSMAMPAVMHDIPRPLHRPAPPDWWTSDEVHAYLAASPYASWRLGWLLALCLGLRRGEIVGLRWRDVDLPGQLIRIRNQRQCIDGKVIDCAPKSASGVRNIPLPLALVDALCEALCTATSPYVIVNIHGQPLTPSGLDQRHQSQLRLSGVRPIRLHDMRHTMATLAIANGCDIRILQTLMGHSNITTTAHTYAHVITDIQRDTVARIAQNVIQCVY